MLEALSELIIVTGSHCLHGKEVRSQLPVHIWVEVLATQPGQVSGRSSSGDQEYFLYNSPDTQEKKLMAFSQLCSILCQQRWVSSDRCGRGSWLACSAAQVHPQPLLPGWASHGPETSHFKKDVRAENNFAEWTDFLGLRSS